MWSPLLCFYGTEHFFLENANMLIKVTLNHMFTLFMCDTDCDQVDSPLPIEIRKGLYIEYNINVKKLNEVYVGSRSNNIYQPGLEL